MDAITTLAQFLGSSHTLRGRRHGASQFGVNPGWLFATHVDPLSWEWRLPPIPGFPDNWRRHQFPGSCASNSGESHWQKDLPTDHVAAIMPASGGWFPSASRGVPGS